MGRRMLAGLPTDEVDACVMAAIDAPSIYNTQPWRFRIRRDSIDVYADLSRQLHVADPAGRELLMSVGAAVFNLRVALLAHGRRPITRLLPGPEASGETGWRDGETGLSGAEAGPAARVTAGPAVVPSHTARSLAAAVPRRHTNRLPYARTPIPADVLDELRASAASEGAHLHLLDPVSRIAVFALAVAARRIELDEAYRRELAVWTNGAPGRHDGIPPSTVGPLDASGVIPLRDFTPGASPRAVPFEPYPQIAVLTTHGDGAWQWLRAGQALQRVLLTATVRGLSAQPMTQPLETPPLRRMLVDAEGGRFAQAIVRLGFGGTAAAAPRRPLDDVLVSQR